MHVNHSVSYPIVLGRSRCVTICGCVVGVDSAAGSYDISTGPSGTST